MSTAQQTFASSFSLLKKIPRHLDEIYEFSALSALLRSLQKSSCKHMQKARNLISEMPFQNEQIRTNMRSSWSLIEYIWKADGESSECGNRQTVTVINTFV